MKKKQFVFILCLVLRSVHAFPQPEEKAPVVAETLIFPAQPQHVHGSSLVSLPNGDLLTCWFQGSGERMADDVRIMGARLKKGSKAWSRPFLLADTYQLPDCNPVLFLNSTNKLFLVWIVVQAHRWECSIIKYRTSVDYDQDGAPVWNWQDNLLLAPGDNFAAAITAGFEQLPAVSRATGSYAPSYDRMVIEASQDPAKRCTGWMTRIKPLLLTGGKILLPLYSDGFNLSMVALSDDDGTTWRPGLPIVGRGNVQPALLQKKNGHIFAFMRDNGDAPARVQYSESADEGLTWLPAAKTTIPNEASVELILLKDGRWAYLGNDEDDGRYRLSLYLSDNEGATWAWKRTIEHQSKGKGRFSYPCLIQTKDGMLRMTYSYSMGEGSEAIKYVVVDPGAIR